MSTMSLGRFAIAKRTAIVAIVAVALLVAACGGDDATPAPTAQPTPEPTPATPTKERPQVTSKTYDAYPDMVIDESKSYTATMETNRGTVVFDLFADEAPLTVNNFVFLAREGYYDGVVFHRIVKNFMIQGGDPSGRGTDGPGYRFSDEPVTRDYIPGTLAMANAGPNTNGSQFFVMQGRTVDLPKSYNIFGLVSEGQEVIDAIADTPVGASPNGERSKPLEEIYIIGIEITEE